VKTEPAEKDVQFAAILKRLVATKDHTTAAEDHAGQPLSNDQTLAVAMQFDTPEGAVKHEIMDADMPAEAAKYQSVGQEHGMEESLDQEDTGPKDLEQEPNPAPPFPEAKQETPQNVQLDEEADMDTSVRDTSPTGQTSPYFTSAADTYVTMPLIHTQTEPMIEHSMEQS
jgi:hypothetical protein